MRKRIIIVGKGASGKDYLLSGLKSLEYTANVSYTTRPPREGEAEGSNYHFVTQPDFLTMLEADSFYEHAEFNTWYYGTTNEFWTNSEIFIMTPKGVSQILQEDRDDCCIVYLDIDEKTRKERISKRSDADSVERRMEADRKDFETFTDYDVIVTDAKFDVNAVVKQCKNLKFDWTTKSVSSSALKAAKISTRNFLHYYRKPKEQKSHFDYGSAIELYILDRAEFDKQVIVFDESKRPVPDKNYQTKVNKEWKDKFYADNEGKLIISSEGDESIRSIETIWEMVNNHPCVDLLLDSGNQFQTEFKWVCPVSGLNRYCRTDLNNPDRNIIIDVKTYAGNSFEKDAANMDHFLQAWDQVLGARANGHEVDKYYWFGISKKYPYHVDFFELDLDQCLRLEELHSEIMYRLKIDLFDRDEKNLVYHKTEVQKIKVPAYYK